MAGNRLWRDGLPAQKTPESGSPDPAMASSPLRPATAAGPMPYWRVIFFGQFRSSLGHDDFDRYKAERFQLVLAIYLAVYFGVGILLPLWEYISLFRSPWLLAVVAAAAAQCVVLAAALRLVRHNRYEQSITLACIGHWAYVSLVTFVNPNLLPVMVLGALVPVVFAVPYVRWQRGLVLLVIAAGCALALVALARFQNVSHLAVQSPRRIETALIIALVPTSALFILGIAWNSARMLRTSKEQLAERAARLVTAADEERRRLERDLHDGAQQHFVALAVDRKSTRLNSSHITRSRMPSSA